MQITEKFVEFEYKKFKHLWIQLMYNKAERTYKVHVVPCNNTSFGRETESMSGFIHAILQVNRRSKSTDAEANGIMNKNETQYLKYFKQ